jgi:hypothetical protein
MSTSSFASIVPADLMPFDRYEGLASVADTGRPAARPLPPSAAARFVPEQARSVFQDYPTKQSNPDPQNQ